MTGKSSDLFPKSTSNRRGQGNSLPFEKQNIVEKNLKTKFVPFDTRISIIHIKKLHKAVGIRECFLSLVSNNFGNKRCHKRVSLGN